MMCVYHIPLAAPPAEHQSCHQSGTARRLALLIAVAIVVIVWVWVWQSVHRSGGSDDPV
jgi:hypothetical protein